MNSCIYITRRHSTGQYYIGKSTVERVNSGYQGSGTIISAALKKYPGEFETTIFVSGLTTEQAYDYERQLVTEHMLADPLCMNLIKGGAFRPEDDANYRDTRNKKIAAGRKKRFASDPEALARQQDLMRAAKTVAAERLASTEFTADGKVFPTLKALRKWAGANRYGLQRVSLKTYTLIDRGFYVDCIRYNRKRDAEQALGAIRKTANRTYTSAPLARKKIQVETSVGIVEHTVSRVTEALEWLKKHHPGYELHKQGAHSYVARPRVARPLGRPRKKAES